MTVWTCARGPRTPRHPVRTRIFKKKTLTKKREYSQAIDCLKISCTLSLILIEKLFNQEPSKKKKRNSELFNCKHELSKANNSTSQFTWRFRSCIILAFLFEARKTRQIGFRGLRQGQSRLQIQFGWLGRLNLNLWFIKSIKKIVYTYF